MLEPLLVTAFMMGLAGGSHCLAMCAAPCSLVTQSPEAATARPAQQVVRFAPQRQSGWRVAAFQAGRLAGYAMVGALAALAMESLAWLTQNAMALRPVWTLAHVAMMAWGAMMILQARQPAWIESAGRTVWSRLQPWVRSTPGVASVGALWALMPCGLLYSAILVAALSGGAWQGAATMAAFAIGSGVWLVGGPWAWGRLRKHLAGLRGQWGTRIAGGLLCAIAAWALWMDLVYKPSLWCR